jgi:hypothetical protein
MPLMPTLANMRSHSVRHVLIFCVNGARCCHSGRMNVDAWPDDTTFESIERRLVCTACGVVGAHVRPDWSERPKRESLTGRF